MDTLYKFENQLKAVERLIITDETISEYNKTKIKEFKRYLILERNLKTVRVVKYMYKLKIVLPWLGKQKCTTATKDDILDILERINGNIWKEWTKHDYKIVVKVFWKWLGKNKLVDWIKVGKPGTNKLPEELITTVEIRNIIKSASCARDKAMIAVLYESNTRIGEFGTIQIKHVVFEIIKGALTAVLIVDGKTGMRRVRIVKSAPYLQKWIQTHPDRDNPNAHVWVNKQDSTLLTYQAFNKILKTTAKAANINKNVHPHLLRHSRSTQLATYLTESQLCYYSGWVMGSNMAAIYVHLSGRDIDNAIFDMNGIS